MVLAKKQAGMSMGSALLLIAVVGTFLVTVIRILPVYMSDAKLSNAFDKLQEEQYKNGQEIRSRLNKYLTIENLEFPMDTIKVESKDHAFDVSMKYEVRKPFLYNIEFVITFDHHVKLDKS